MTILVNTSTRTVLHFDANGSVVVVGNNTVSNLTSTSTETVKKSRISQVWFGSDAGSWQVTQGNSTVNSVAGVFSGTGHMPFHQSGVVLDVNPTGESLYATLDGAANGFIMIELHKKSAVA